jgi:hypothetical protein
MSSSISTLLTRNLHDVFGENDPARRRAQLPGTIVAAGSPTALRSIIRITWNVSRFLMFFRSLKHGSVLTRGLLSATGLGRYSHSRSRCPKGFCQLLPRPSSIMRAVPGALLRTSSARRFGRPISNRCVIPLMYMQSAKSAARPQRLTMNMIVRTAKRGAASPVQFLCFGVVGDRSALGTKTSAVRSPCGTHGQTMSRARHSTEGISFRKKFRNGPQRNWSGSLLNPKNAANNCKRATSKRSFNVSSRPHRAVCSEVPTVHKRCARNSFKYAFTQQIRISLAGFGELDDSLGNDFVGKTAPV